MGIHANTKTASFREGTQRLAEQWPYLRYLGMGLWWAWIWLCYSGIALFGNFPMADDALNVGYMYLFSTPAIATALIAAALLSRWRCPTASIALKAASGAPVACEDNFLRGFCLRGTGGFRYTVCLRSGVAPEACVPMWLSW